MKGRTPSITVPCPVCGAPEGERCRGRQGQLVGYHHLRREHARLASPGNQGELFDAPLD